MVTASRELGIDPHSILRGQSPAKVTVVFRTPSPQISMLPGNPQGELEKRSTPQTTLKFGGAGGKPQVAKLQLLLLGGVRLLRRSSCSLGLQYFRRNVIAARLVD